MNSYLTWHRYTTRIYIYTFLSFYELLIIEKALWYIFWKWWVKKYFYRGITINIIMVSIFSMWFIKKNKIGWSHLVRKNIVHLYIVTCLLLLLINICVITYVYINTCTMYMHMCNVACIAKLGICIKYMYRHCKQPM